MQHLYVSAFHYYLAVDCGKPRPLQNGSIIGKETKYPNIVYHRCNEGFLLRGPSAIKCQTNGTWSTTPSFCEGILMTIISSNEQNKNVKGKYVRWKLTYVVVCSSRKRFIACFAHSLFCLSIVRNEDKWHYSNGFCTCESFRRRPVLSIVAKQI